MELLILFLTIALVCVSALVICLVFVQPPRDPARDETYIPGWYESLWGVHTPLMLRVCIYVAVTLFLCWRSS